MNRGTGLSSPSPKPFRDSSQYKNIGLPSTWRTSGR
jgi:hypothetical protein